MKIAPNSRVVAAAVAVLALGTIAASAQPSSGAAPLSARLASASRVAQQAGGSGYWLVGADGGVFAFGTAHFYGSLAGKHLATPITGILATADGHGYWLVAKDGSVFNFGDATSMGSMSGKALAAPMVGMTSSNGGASGPTGPQGPAGSRGPVGPAGATGPARAVNYAYIYNNAPETVAIEGAVPFDSNGLIDGFTHIPGGTAIGVTTAGVYRVNFSVSAVEPGQFALAVNGVPAPQAIYGSGAGTQQDDGQVILSLGAGDIVTLLNHSSAAAITLQSLAGGTQPNVNASMIIEQLG